MLCQSDLRYFEPAYSQPAYSQPANSSYRVSSGPPFYLLLIPGHQQMYYSDTLRCEVGRIRLETLSRIQAQNYQIPELRLKCRANTTLKWSKRPPNSCFGYFTQFLYFDGFGPLNIYISISIEYGWKPYRDLFGQKSLSRASIYWHMRETQRGTVSSRTRDFKQY